MNKCLFFASATFLLSAVVVPRWLDSELGSSATADGIRSGPRILAAATALYEALGEDGRKAATFAFGGKEHVDWHFVPRDRVGVVLSKLSVAQRAKLKALLVAGLGAAGYKKVEEVRSLEAVLQQIEGPNRRFSRDPELYFLSFFGAPSKAGKWGWRYEGHHLSVNFQLEGDRLVSATPSFFGSNPGTVKDGPKKGLQVLKYVETIPREFMNALDDAQRARALGEEVPDEVPSTQKAAYDGPFPAGVDAASLSEAQIEILRRWVDAYLLKLPPDVSRGVWKQIEKDGGLKKFHIAWRGSSKPFEAHSYLVHSPSYVINYSNTQNGANHVHSSFRLRSGDFGSALKD